MKTYCLYELLTIVIEDDVSSNVTKSIDFQLNHFKYDGIERNSLSDYVIRVKAYNKFNLPNIKGLVINYSLKGKWNECCIDPLAKLAIVKTVKGFDIYCSQPNFLITIFIQILLLEKGIYFIHAAGIVNKEDQAILLTGAGGVGKTASINGFISNYGYKLLGDDIIAVKSSGESLPFPRSFIIKEYHENVYPHIYRKFRKSTRQRIMTSIKEFIRLNAPFRDVIRTYLIKKGIKDNVMEGWHREPYVAAVPVRLIFGKSVIAESSKARIVIDMVRYQGKEFEYIQLDKNEMLMRINAVIGFEWHSSLLPIINMGLFGMFNMEEYKSKTSEIGRKFLNNIDCCRLYIPEKCTPDELAAYLADIIER